MPKIIFRCDGNTQIGLGHIIRSMALAHMLKGQFECLFLCQNPSESLKKQISELAQVEVLPQTDEYKDEASFIVQNYLQGNEIVVLDGYNFDTEYQKIIKTKGSKLVCIDDIHSFHFVADVIINHAGGIVPEDYSAEPYTKFCLGIDYALLRKPFLEATKQKRVIRSIEHVFICFGGSDISNLSLKAVQVCLSIPEIKKIVVVLGGAYDHKSNDFPQKVEVHQNLSAVQMVQMMQNCELAIVPASSISIEALACKMILLTGYTADNQQGIYHHLIKYPSVFPINNYQKTEIDDFTKKVQNIVGQDFKSINFASLNSEKNLIQVFEQL